VQSAKKEKTNELGIASPVAEDKKERVHRYFRNGIFRKGLFEIYDNLHDMKPIEELVEEGAYKAAKEVMVNRAAHISKNKIKVNPDKIAEEVRLEFPYRMIPQSEEKARNFFVATVCNITAEKISLLFEIDDSSS
jgi:hypothetical protein